MLVVFSLQISAEVCHARCTHCHLETENFVRIFIFTLESKIYLTLLIYCVLVTKCPTTLDKQNSFPITNQYNDIMVININFMKLSTCNLNKICLTVVYIVTQIYS